MNMHYNKWQVCSASAGNPHLEKCVYANVPRKRQWAIEICILCRRVGHITAVIAKRNAKWFANHKSVVQLRTIDI